MPAARVSVSISILELARFRARRTTGPWALPVQSLLPTLTAMGKPDLVVSVSFGVSILLNGGNGTFLGATGYSANPGQVVVGDFNGDGRVDVATSGGSVLLGQGNGSFQQGPSFAAGGTSLVVGDFNGDGKSDLAYVINNNCTNFVNVFLASSNGTLTLAHSYALNADIDCPGVGSSCRRRCERRWQSRFDSFYRRWRSLVRSWHRRVNSVRQRGTKFCERSRCARVRRFCRRRNVGICWRLQR